MNFWMHQLVKLARYLPFYDNVVGSYEEQMGQWLATEDPFYEKIPKKDPRLLKGDEQMSYKKVRRQPPPSLTEPQLRAWKAVIKRAWFHDRNFLGFTSWDLGCGMISFLSIIPIIGSLIAYRMHYKMIRMCGEAGCPASIQAKMIGNVGVDFLVTLVPLLGGIMIWLKASSTRNAAMFDTWLRESSLGHPSSSAEKELPGTYAGHTGSVKDPQLKQRAI